MRIIKHDQYFGDVNGILIDNMYDAYYRNEQLKYIKQNKVNMIISQDYDISYLNEICGIKYITLPE